MSKAFDTLNQVDLANRSRLRHGTSRHLIWLFLGVLLTAAAVILLRDNVRVGHSRQSRVITSPVKGPGILSPGSVVEPSPSAVPATLSWDLPGFVLQVAAMKHEDNADALAETLRQSNFPAFVFQRGAAPFYRVAVGVYGDDDSAVRAKDDLERQGFKAILKRWIPE